MSAGGVNQWLLVVFGACPASLVLVHLLGARPGLSCNRAGGRARR